MKFFTYNLHGESLIDRYIKSCFLILYIVLTKYNTFLITAVPMAYLIYVYYLLNIRILSRPCGASFYNLSLILPYNVSLIISLLSVGKLIRSNKKYYYHLTSIIIIKSVLGGLLEIKPNLSYLLIIFQLTDTRLIKEFR